MNSEERFIRETPMTGLFGAAELDAEEEEGEEDEGERSQPAMATKNAATTRNATDHAAEERREWFMGVLEMKVDLAV
jgi:hypothetical protein